MLDLENYMNIDGIRFSELIDLKINQNRAKQHTDAELTYRNRMGRKVTNGRLQAFEETLEAFVYLKMHGDNAQEPKKSEYEAVLEKNRFVAPKPGD